MTEKVQWEIANLVYGALADLVGGWALMVMIGVIYGEFGLLKPVGYWVSTFIVLLAGICASALITPIYRYQRRHLEQVDLIIDRMKG